MNPASATGPPNPKVPSLRKCRPRRKIDGLGAASSGGVAAVAPTEVTRFPRLLQYSYSASSTGTEASRCAWSSG